MAITADAEHASAAPSIWARGVHLSLIHMVYWSLGCLLLGVILAPLVTGPMPEDHSGHFTHDHALHEGTTEVDPLRPAQVSLRVVKDASAGWNVFVDTENFRFAPESVNADNLANEGHAHLYVNNVKITRLYGPAYHMADLPEGPHKIMVSLNANDHTALVSGGEYVAATATIVQPPQAE